MPEVLEDHAARLTAQREAALAEANRVRVVRSELKAELRGMSERDARCFVASALRDRLDGHASLMVGDLPVRPSDLASMRIGELLTCIPKIGISKAAKLLRAWQISGTQPIGRLTDRQAIAIGYALTAGSRVLTTSIWPES